MLSRLCCMRLNTVGVVVGWFGTVASFVSVVLLSFGLANEDQLAEWIVQEYKQKGEDIDVNKVVTILAFTLIVYLVIVLINLLASVLLILGTVKERHLLLVPWLINSGISLLFSFIYTVYFFFAQLSWKVQAGSILVWLIFAGFGLAFNFIIWYAIYSLFKQLQANREQQQQLLRSGPGATTGTTYPSYTKL